MKIGIDIDEVLAGFQTPFLDYINKIYNTHYVFDDITSYDYESTINLAWPVAKQHILDFYQTDEFAGLPQVKFAEEGIEQIRHGNKLFLITARPLSTQKVTQEWIESNFGNVFSDIIYVDQITKSGTKKVDFCVKHGFVQIIEDNPHELASYTDAGITVHLLDKPWNRHVENNKLLTRSANWKEIVSAFS